MPGYNRVVQPLADLMEAVYKAGGGRTKQKVQNVELCQVGWNRQHDACLEDCKQMLAKAACLAHPDPEKSVCVFTDASERHWCTLVTQVSMDNREKQVEDQDHEPLFFLSGTFSGAAERWSIVEKETFAIVETFRRVYCLLHRPTTMRILNTFLTMLVHEQRCRRIRLRN